MRVSIRFFRSFSCPGLMFSRMVKLSQTYLDESIPLPPPLKVTDRQPQRLRPISRQRQNPADGLFEGSQALHRRHVQPSVTETTLDAFLEKVHDVHARTASHDRDRSLLCLRDIEEIIQERLTWVEGEEIELVEHKDDALGRLPVCIL